MNRINFFIIIFLFFLLFSFSLSGQSIPYNDEFLIDSYNIRLNRPATAGLVNGGWVVCGDRGMDIYAQMFNLNGQKVGGEFLVNTSTEGRQDGPEFTSLSNGNIVIIWKSS